MKTDNVDPAEIAKFAALAARWWDPSSEFKPLHDINPLRLDYIERRAPLCERRVLDVGCGGGILAEALAGRGAHAMGIDAAEGPLSVARLHLLESGLSVEYRQATAERLATEMPARFDVVTCMELLEHVPDPTSVIEACARLVRPGGDVFFATINRNPKSYLLAVLGAEYVLGLLPRGTHRYERFIRPSELDRWARRTGLLLRDLTGMTYNPINARYALTRDVDVNYLAHYRREFEND